MHSALFQASHCHVKVCILQASGKTHLPPVAVSNQVPQTWLLPQQSIHSLHSNHCTYSSLLLLLLQQLHYVDSLHYVNNCHLKARAWTIQKRLVHDKSRGQQDQRASQLTTTAQSSPSVHHVVCQRTRQRRHATAYAALRRLRADIQNLFKQRRQPQRGAYNAHALLSTSLSSTMHFKHPTAVSCSKRVTSSCC